MKPPVADIVRDARDWLALRSHDVPAWLTVRYEAIVALADELDEWRELAAGLSESLSEMTRERDELMREYEEMNTQRHRLIVEKMEAEEARDELLSFVRDVYEWTAEGPLDLDASDRAKLAAVLAKYAKGGDECT